MGNPSNGLLRTTPLASSLAFKFADKYAFDSTSQDLQDVQIFASLQTQHFSKKSVSKISSSRKIQQNVTKRLQDFAEI